MIRGVNLQELAEGHFSEAGDNFKVDTCRYLTDWLTPGLSDHAAVEAAITLNG